MRILIHGFLGSPGDWARVVSNLPSDTPIDTPLLPAHDPEVPVVEMDDWIERQIEQSNAASVDLVGYSMGGRVALRWASRHPDHIRSLALVSSSPGLMDPVERESRLQKDMRWADLLGQLPRSQFLELWYQQPVFESLQRDASRLHGVCSSRTRSPGEGLADLLVRWSPGRVHPLWDSLNELRMPSLWVAGADDGPYAEIAQRAASLSMRGYARMVPRAGHQVLLEQPDLLAAILNEFWSAQ